MDSGRYQSSSNPRSTRSPPENALAYRDKPLPPLPRNNFELRKENVYATRNLEPSKAQMTSASQIGFVGTMVNYPIFKALCDNLCTLKDLFALRLVSKQLSTSHAAYVKHKWDVDIRLQHFFKNPYGFRCEMAKYNVIISGSFAVQFFDSSTWGNTVLELYIEEWRDATDFEKYLEEVEGYTLHVALIPAKNALIRSLEIRSYHRAVNEGHATRLRLTYVTLPHIQSLLKRSWSTVALNFISANAAYSLYPKPTFLAEKRWGYLKHLNVEDFDFIGALGVYTKHGWEVNAKPYTLEYSEDMEPRRRVGDEGTWKIKFGDEEQIIPKCTTSWPLEGLLFKMVLTAFDGQSWGLLEPGIGRSRPQTKYRKRSVWDLQRLNTATRIMDHPGLRRTYVFDQIRA